jgi:hypothetical protein
MTGKLRVLERGSGLHYLLEGIGRHARPTSNPPSDLKAQ